MAKLAITFEDKQGTVMIGVTILEGSLPIHPRGFTNAQETCDGVLRLMRSVGPEGAVKETLSEYIVKLARAELKMN